MRIVIDMQAAQTESRFRGIGRYTISFVEAVCRNSGEHEIILALNGIFDDTLAYIRDIFCTLLPPENIRVWHSIDDVSYSLPNNTYRKDAAKIIREAFLASLEPDIIHVCSLFEGYVDDAVTSLDYLDNKIPTTVMLYDLIPLMNADKYLIPMPDYAHFYKEKIKDIKNASLLLAISKSSMNEAECYLDFPSEQVVNISTAVDSKFKNIAIDDNKKASLLLKYGIERKFILYSGGGDERKNLHRLIKAYAELPRNIRAEYQLVLVGRMPERCIEGLKSVASKSNLSKNELVITGYVSDDELISFYNLCELFVFPSWHEGFGLPVLEAMSCGTPVICSNTSSLPEVIGDIDATFDPMSVNSIKSKMLFALENEEYRFSLRENGLRQAEFFSWDKTAQKALDAWESVYSDFNCWHADKSIDYRTLLTSLVPVVCDFSDSDLMNIANCISKNERNGIERQLFVDISELSQRDAATGVQRVVRNYLKWLLISPPKGFRVAPVYATISGTYFYANKFINKFIGKESKIEEDTPIYLTRGDVFLCLDLQHHVQLSNESFYKKAINSGVIVKFFVYDLLPIQYPDFFKNSEISDLHYKLMKMIAQLDGAICISKATSDTLENWISTNSIYKSQYFKNSWLHIGCDIDVECYIDELPEDISSAVKKDKSQITFLCVSTIEPRKCQELILDSIEILWSEGIDVNLIFVGKEGWKVEAFAERLRHHHELNNRLYWFDGISDEYLQVLYKYSSCLISASINEGFGLPVVEAARNGIPLVLRDIPVFREIAGDNAHYFSGGVSELAISIKSWIGLFSEDNHPKSTGINMLTWQQSTERLKEILLHEAYPRKQLLVDISELVVQDAKTGIQRVVRSILNEWVKSPPKGYRVEPVYGNVGSGYKYARKFLSRFIHDTSDFVESDDPVEYAPGDIWIGLDLQPSVVVSNKDFFNYIKNSGVQVYFVVYDLLCVKFPQYFSPGAEKGFIDWLSVVMESNGALCISKDVAFELSEWRKEHSINQGDFLIDWFHLGADVENSCPSKGIPDNAERIITSLKTCPSFIMVGTLEPRKGHEQILHSFEELWCKGIDVNLVIIGKEGWLVNSLVDEIISHAEYNKRLFWFDSVSDEYLQILYTASSCLIAASYGEGFGLPLIEAAQNNIPIIARDIPVFREVAGEHAFYFENDSSISKDIEAWLALFQSGNYPRSERISWLTWRESANRLLKIIDRN
ncbi:glycosyltransferase family 4 protein [Dickeya oryzae]|uniref:glycosyltransferase family 4 protein n=1 Tax=Dickeya oryzae TaxID=1240404 RepID=UPI0020968AB5|nr:glycosyltransferase family 1 protein [Dickeya oryzae]MCO7253982.1 glycosyltransferase family 4 protein [Dickeya oryzae]